MGVVSVAVFAIVLLFLQHSSQAGVKFTEVDAPQSPLISFRIIVRVGSINDPKGKAGLNELTASMLAEGGTQELKYPQVLEKLYPWAATISVQADKELTTFEGKVHRDFLNQFYELFSSLILKPRFDTG